MELKRLYLSVQSGARVVRGHGMVGPAGQGWGVGNKDTAAWNMKEQYMRSNSDNNSPEE